MLMMVMAGVWLHSLSENVWLQLLHVRRVRPNSTNVSSFPSPFVRSEKFGWEERLDRRRAAEYGIRFSNLLFQQPSILPKSRAESRESYVFPPLSRLAGLQL